MNAGRLHQAANRETSAPDHKSAAQRRQHAGPHGAIQAQLVEAANNSSKAISQRRLAESIHQAPRLAAQRRLATSFQGGTRMDAALQGNAAPVQRVIVRVGFDQAAAGSWNPFVAGAHRAISTKVNALPANQKIFDYDAAQHNLNEDRDGIIGNELHVVGHGQPGQIGGQPAATLALDIRTALGAAAAGINAVRLHSCFSNVAEPGTNSSGANFSGEFAGAAVEAATGIHYADTTTNLPPRFTGFKYGAQAAKRALIASYQQSGTNLRDEAPVADSDERKKILEAARSFNVCINPMEKFLKERVAVVYAGLDPSNAKTPDNQGHHDRVQTDARVEIDDMPPNRPYPVELGSLRGGLAETYHFTAGVWDKLILSYQQRGMATKEKQMQTSKLELTTAYQTCIANFNSLRQKMP